MAAEVLKFPGGFPECPKGLKASGKTMWKKGAGLWSQGLITDRDIEAWRMLCEAFDEIDHCDKIVSKDGEYQISSQGTYSEHPALRRRRAAEQKVLRYQKLFGLVPDARKKRP